MSPLGHEIALAVHRARVQTPRRWDDMPDEWQAECTAIAAAVLRAVQWVDRRESAKADQVPGDDPIALEVCAILRAMLCAESSIPEAPFIDDHLANLLAAYRAERDRAEVFKA